MRFAAPIVIGFTTFPTSGCAVSSDCCALSTRTSRA